jgi:hypothetical protein
MQILYRKWNPMKILYKQTSYIGFTMVRYKTLYRAIFYTGFLTDNFLLCIQHAGNPDCFIFQIFTSAGEDAGSVISSTCISKAFYHARYRFTNGQYYAGLMSTLNDYK